MCRMDPDEVAFFEPHLIADPDVVEYQPVFGVGPRNLTLRQRRLHRRAIQRAIRARQQQLRINRGLRRQYQLEQSYREVPYNLINQIEDYGTAARSG